MRRQSDLPRLFVMTIINISTIFLFPVAFLNVYSQHNNTWIKTKVLMFTHKIEQEKFVCLHPFVCFKSAWNNSHTAMSWVKYSTQSFLCVCVCMNLAELSVWLQQIACHLTIRFVIRRLGWFFLIISIIFLANFHKPIKMSTLTVLTPNGRRHNVKVEPNTALIKVNLQ